MTVFFQHRASWNQKKANLIIHLIKKNEQYFVTRSPRHRACRDSHSATRLFGLSDDITVYFCFFNRG